MKKNLLIQLILPAVLLFCSQAGAATTEEFNSALERHLSCLPIQLVDINRQEILITNEQLCLATIYSTAGMKPLWVSENGPGEKAAVLLHYLENAYREGLQPSDYNIEQIKGFWQSRQPDDLAQLDTLLTLNFIKYAHDVSYGRILPFTTDPVLFAEAGDPHFKPAQIVEQALAANDLAGYLTGLPPSHTHYRKLREALQYFRDIAGSGSWEKVPDGKTLHPGDLDKRVRKVRQRLAATEDIAPAAENENLYDDQLIPTVKKFQNTFGLEEDGIIGKKTLAALNITPEEIIRKIIINMTRWRWQEHDLGRRYIMVNIASYDLRAVEDGRDVLDMAVIVGQLQHQTPVFSHQVRYVDFNPFWNIPPSIARNEELPALRKDPYYLVNRKVRLFSNWQDDAVELDSTGIDWRSVTPREMNRYKLRQDPGPWNALGPVKLVFPNRYNVYIHGTPAQELFERNDRNFSHGCIRASKPLELVKFALEKEKQEWSMEKIREIVAEGKRKVVSVTAPLPVHITYQTVWVDNLGTIHFNNDTYGRDTKLAEILFTRDDSTAGSPKKISSNE